jgi:hypothetical protein
VPFFFRDNAKKLYARLSVVDAPWELRNEALELEELFDRLEREKATSGERMATIQRFLSLHRRSLEYLVKK